MPERLGRPPVLLGRGHRHHDRQADGVRPRRAPRRPSCPRPSPPRARSRASTGRCGSAGAATWTAACARRRTSTCSRTHELDLVICLNPTSTLRAGAPRAAPAAMVAGQARAGAGRRLGSEAKKVRAAGTEVLLIQPEAEDLARDGQQPHERPAAPRGDRDRDRDRGPPARGARGAASCWRTWPAGEPHKLRRPDGPPASWPPIVPASHPEAA